MQGKNDASVIDIETDIDDYNRILREDLILKGLKKLTPKQKNFELKVAIFSNDIVRARLLIAAKVDLYHKYNTHTGHTPAHLALAYGRIEIYQEMCRVDKQVPRLTDNFGRTPGIYAIKRGIPLKKIDRIYTLIQGEDCKDKNLNGVLHYAARFGAEGVYEYLVSLNKFQDNINKEREPKTAKLIYARRTNNNQLEKEAIREVELLLRPKDKIITAFKRDDVLSLSALSHSKVDPKDFTKIYTKDDDYISWYIKNYNNPVALKILIRKINNDDDLARYLKVAIDSNKTIFFNVLITDGANLNVLSSSNLIFIFKNLRSPQNKELVINEIAVRINQIFKNFLIEEMDSEKEEVSCLIEALKLERDVFFKFTHLIEICVIMKLKNEVDFLFSTNIYLSNYVSQESNLNIGQIIEMCLKDSPVNSEDHQKLLEIKSFLEEAKNRVDEENKCRNPDPSLWVERVKSPEVVGCCGLGAS